MTLLQRPPGASAIESSVPLCDPARSATPCWQAVTTGAACARRLQLCWDAPCNPGKEPATPGEAVVSCAR